ncbi:LysR family transcriptional regulator [Parahaliea sp. F7430]|uniref:LysR family transcriptional regulator n=1 Tax=Sediminihaliea albiluteola TaxID=2758564 RepID=A0A7W2TXQ7_9GAMM|nr:LysR family transcriptional regulator [Sediminihaliea albiluteola]MBA6413890.1 LysR family transcriptional regulator [Sediminihaliea albiluteola]
MDIELARTFLEIARAGSFVAAAERLHLTQTAVTARIQKLEALLDSRLFLRNRAGARLTAEGERFTVHALQLVQAWDKARSDMALPQGHRARLSVAAEASLWQPLLFNWICWMREHQPEVALHVEVDNAESLFQRLEQRMLDLVLVHRPDYFPGLQVEQLVEEKLIMVRAPQDDSPYLFVDWGPEFVAQHDVALPGKRGAALSFNFGPLALQYLLEVGGSGYFRSRVVQRHLNQRSLLPVAGAPEFTYPVYAVFATDSPSSPLLKALEGVRSVASEGGDWSLPVI